MKKTHIWTSFGAVALVLATAACSSGGSDTAASESPAASAAVPASVTEACTAEKSPTIADIQSRGTLEWATGMSPPFTFTDDTGAYIGVEPDNAAELAAILGVDLKITEYDYSLLPPAVTSGKADIIGAQLFDTEERRQAIDFSDPYYLSGQLFYVDADSSYQTIDDLNVSSNTFAFGSGTAQGDLATTYIPDAPQVEAALRGALIPYDLLSTDRAQSTMGESGVMRLLLNSYTNPKLAAIGVNGRVTTDLPTEDDIIDPFKVAFGFGKEDDGFADCINAWTEDLVETGREADRIEYWAEELQN